MRAVDASVLRVGLLLLAAGLGATACGTTEGPRRSDEGPAPAPAVSDATDARAAAPAAVASPPTAASDAAAFRQGPVLVPKGAAVVEAAAAERSPLRGEPVPDFRLANQDGEEFSIADHAGRWVVMYFYPENDTPGCTCQATEFTEIVKEYAKRDAPVVGISPDSRVSHRNFIEKYGLKLTLLSDPALDVARRFGATRTWKLSSGILETVVRSTLLVDPEGRIAWHWPEVVPEGHAQRVLEKLVELRGS